MQKYIKEENKRKKEEIIFGGLVIKEGEHFRINSDEKYQPFELATGVREKQQNIRRVLNLKNKKGGNILSFNSFAFGKSPENPNPSIRHRKGIKTSGKVGFK